jgi:hypothetical protein
LGTNDWEKAIIWDEPTEEMKNPKLILDLNDSNMTFDRDENYEGDGGYDGDSDNESEEETVELRRGTANKRKRSVLFPKA